MYEIDELTPKGYKYVFESENLMEIDKIVFKIVLWLVLSFPKQKYCN